MRRGGLAILSASALLAAFAFSVFLSEPTSGTGARHWAAAPLLAVSIILAMGGLVAVATARRGNLR